MLTRNVRILGLGFALATMLTLGATLRAPGGLVPVGDDEASGVQGGAATCGTAALDPAGNGCGIPGYCVAHTSYTNQGPGTSSVGSFQCSANNTSCGFFLNNTCN
jgi:hypothetical protein